MKKLILIILVFALKISAQSEVRPGDCSPNSNFLFFGPKTQNIYMVKQEYYGQKGEHIYYWKTFLSVFSRQDGKLIRDIQLSRQDTLHGIPFTMDVYLSHDEKSLLIFGSRDGVYYYDTGPFVIRKYIIDENRLVWEKELEDKASPLRAAFSENNKQIICVTSKYLAIFDAETGNLIRKSDNISSIIDPDTRFPRYDLSRNGKYFAYWKAKYLTLSEGDESVFLGLFDFLWYGVKWMFCLGSIPQHLYLWDIDQDRLYDEIPTPYESDKGIPVFTEDERELLIGPYDGNYKVYSVPEKKIKRTFFQKESDYPALEERHTIQDTDFKRVSPDSNLFAACFNSFDLYLINYQNGALVKKFKQTLGRTVSNQYAMAFSRDGEYFAMLGNKYVLNLYNTRTWEKVWEVSAACNK